MDDVSFRLRFPEFRTASNTLINSVIAEATARVASDVFGDLTEAAIGYLAAHLLAVSPFGKNQRLEDSTTVTTYWTEYITIRQQVVVRIFVT